MKELGAFCETLHGGAYQRPGLPDLMTCLKGRYIAIELKAPGRYKSPYDGLSPAQQAVLYEIASAGGIVIVADSLDAILESLRREGLV